MKLIDLEFIKDIKIGDFALGCIATLNLLYPAFITWYFFDRNFLIDNSILVIILSAISIGFIFNILTINNTVYKLKMDDVTMTFESLKTIFPLIIAKQGIDFTYMFLFIWFPLTISEEWISENFGNESILLLVIISYSFVSSVERLLFRKK